MHLDQVVRWLALVHAGFLLAACTAVPIPTAETATKGNWTWTDSVEVSNLISVYQLQDSVQSQSVTERAAQIRELTAIPAESRSVAQHLQLSLLLGAVETGSADYEGAREALLAARVLVDDKPLLVAHIDALLDQFDKLSQLDLNIKHLSRENRELHRLVQRLREQRIAASRIATETAASNKDDAALDATDVTDDDGNNETATTKAANSAATSPDGNALDTQQDSTSSDRDADTRAVELTHARRLLRLARNELKKRDQIINEQNSKITVLEAKIKALSAIERNLNQREDQLNRDIKNETGSDAQREGDSPVLEATGGVQQDRTQRVE